MLGDEGSAAWIGRTAIARTIGSLENRDLATNILPAILEAAGLAQSGDLIRYVHHDADKAKIATLAPIVSDAAGKGDPLALDILSTGAGELALLVKSVIGQSPWINRKELVLAGGVIENDRILRNGVEKILGRDFPALKVSAPKGSALEGASMLAISLGSGKQGLE